MYNLLIALAAGTLGFVLGGIFGSWIQGIIPALLVFPVVYVLLARRTGKKVEAIMRQAVAELESGRSDNCRRIMEKALDLAPWQFLLQQQVKTQLGALEYMQRNFKAARPLLENSWARNWQAMGMLAAIDLREGRSKDAVQRLVKCHKHGKKDAVMWGLYAYACVQCGDVDEALAVTNKGLGVLDESRPLKELKSALANQRVKRFKWGRVFGQSWLQFFPEQASMKHAQAMAGARKRKTYPMPRR